MADAAESKTRDAPHRIMAGAMEPSSREFARKVIETEADALRVMAQAALADEFDRAVQMMLDCGGAVLVTGVGKAGHIARKVSATLASTGTPSHFLSPTDAVHGDLGAI